MIKFGKIIIKLNYKKKRRKRRLRGTIGKAYRIK
jgi:hypothetical protein